MSDFERTERLKEIIADDLETALELAADRSAACNRRVELRPFLG